MKLLKLTGIIALIILVSSCGKNLNCTSGNGNKVTETRSLAGFTEVVSELPVDIYLSNSEDSEVRLEGSSNLVNLIKTKVSGNRLTITTDNNTCLRITETFRIYVSSPTISAIEIRGSGNATNQGKLTAYSMRASIEGSGDINLNNLEVETYDAYISGSGDIRLRGSNNVSHGDIRIEGSGDVDAFNMIAKIVNVDISGSGSAGVHATEQLNVDITGSGDVRYLGSPTINTNITGSGEVKRK